MKILFVTDLHGNRGKYDRLIRAALDEKADVVINGGDMLPKEGDLFRQGEFIRGDLKDHFAQFERADIYYLCYLGNDDVRIFDGLFDDLCKQYRIVINLAQQKCEIGKYDFIGMNYVVDYPFRLKDRCRKDTVDYQFQRQLGTGLLSTKDGWREIEDWPAYAAGLPTIEDELNRLPTPRDMNNAVYVIHMPPNSLGLDECGTGEKVGSKAVYNFLMKSQPKLSLHGHIHESPEMTGQWHANIGKTLCIQPGQLGNGLTYVTIDMTTMKYIRKVT